MWRFLAMRLSPLLDEVVSRLHHFGTRLTQIRIKLNNQATCTIPYVRVHRKGILSLALAIAVLAIVVVFWPFWVMKLAALPKLILNFAHHHPHASRILRVSLEAVPDLAFVFLAHAGLSYLMPGLIHKFEMSKPLRLIASVVFVVFGLAAVIMNSVSREDQENQQRIDRNKIDIVGGQVHDTLQFLVQSKGQPDELDRRRHILDALRSRYILEHPEITAEMVAGNANPPADWMNKQLQELGEEWPYVPPRMSTVGPIPRSYVVWADMPRFAGGEQVGDPITVAHLIAFNVYFKQSGPNQVEVQGIFNRLYIKPDNSLETQNTIIEDFDKRQKLADQSVKPPTMMPNENPHFFSPVAVDDSGSYRLATQDDLDNLRDGREFIYVVALIIYKDASNDPKKEHHLPLCLQLQPPAKPPGVWHYCEAGFNRSD